MKVYTQAYCSVCGAMGPKGRTRSFVCGECADPDEVRTYCSNCRNRVSHETKEAIKLFGDVLQSLVKIEGGTILRFDFCPTCKPDEEKTPTIDVFGIA